MRPDRGRSAAACLCRSTRHSSLTPFHQPSSDECRRWLVRCLWRSPCSLLAARPGSRRSRRSWGRRSQRRPVRSRPSGVRGSSSGTLWFTCRDSSTTCGEGTRSRAGRSSYHSCCRTSSASTSPARAASRPMRPTARRKVRSCTATTATQYRRSPPLHDRCTPPPPHYRHCCSIPADVSLLLPHPLSHYGCLAIVGALARPWARQADQWLKLVLDAAFLAALGLLMLRLPTRLMPLLCLWSVPLSISSYTVQALETVRTHVETKARSVRPGCQRRPSG